jgi:hypothetical protein
MPLFHKPIESLNESDLLALIANGVPEGKGIDYKRYQIGNSDGDKRELLYDVSSFANSSGGHLIIGMDESAGVPTYLTGLSGDPDAEVSRIEQIIRDGLRPSIPGCRCVAVRLANAKFIIVVRIPKSWNPPHQVVFQKSFRFYGRGSNGKYLLDVDELRSIFSLSQSAAESIRLFRIDRIAKIVAGEGPFPLANFPKKIVHFVPLSAFTVSSHVNLDPLWRNRHELVNLHQLGGSARYNVDGLASYASNGNECIAYAQIFRNGCIEIVTRQREWAPRGVKVLPSVSFGKELIDQFKAASISVKTLGLSPPLIVMLTFCGIRDWEMGVGGMMFDEGHKFDRDPLIIPEILIDDLEHTPSTLARPLIDAVWNAAGWERSLDFNESGEWEPRQG